jgi:hypothetical protein
MVMVKQLRKPHKFKKKKPIYLSRFFWLGLLIFVFIISSCYLIFFYDFFQIKKVESSDEEIGLFIKEKIKQDFFFFSSQSIFLIDTGKIEKVALERFPRINEIKIKRSFPDKLAVSISWQTPFFIFCLTSDLEEENEAVMENCFILDKEGIAFEKESAIEEQYRQEIFRLKKLSSEDNQIFLGSKIIEKKDLEEISNIYYFFEENLKIKLKEVIILPEKLVVLTHEGWSAYFDLKGDIEWQINKLRFLLKEKISKERRGSLQYIELRFGNYANPKYIDS